MFVPVVLQIHPLHLYLNLKVDVNNKATYYLITLLHYFFWLEKITLKFGQVVTIVLFSKGSLSDIGLSTLGGGGYSIVGAKWGHAAS